MGGEYYIVWMWAQLGYGIWCYGVEVCMCEHSRECGEYWIKVCCNKCCFMMIDV